MAKKAKVAVVAAPSEADIAREKYHASFSYRLFAMLGHPLYLVEWKRSEYQAAVVKYGLASAVRHSQSLIAAEKVAATVKMIYDHMVETGIDSREVALAYLSNLDRAMSDNIMRQAGGSRYSDAMIAAIDNIEWAAVAEWVRYELRHVIMVGRAEMDAEHATAVAAGIPESQIDAFITAVQAEYGEDHRYDNWDD